MFRLNIDIPLGENEEEAILAAKDILADIKDTLQICGYEEAKQAKYRLSNDNDRTARNYLVKDENGHVSKNKSKMFE